MGQLMAGMNSLCCCSTQGGRTRDVYCSFLPGQASLKTFQFLHAIGKKWLRNLWRRMALLLECMAMQREDLNVPFTCIHRVRSKVLVFIHWAACLASTRTNSWVHSHCSPASTIQWEQERCVEGIPWSCWRSQWHTTSCLLRLLLPLEDTCTISSRHKATIRSVLAMPTKQLHNHLVCQFIQLRQVCCSQWCLGTPTNCQDGEITLQKCTWGLQ